MQTHFARKKLGDRTFPSPLYSLVYHQIPDGCLLPIDELVDRVVGYYRSHPNERERGQIITEEFAKNTVLAMARDQYLVEIHGMKLKKFLDSAP